MHSANPGSKDSSTVTGACEKRKIHVQPAARMWDPSYLDQERACSTEASVSSSAGLDALQHPVPFSGVTAESDRRESERPLVAGAHEPQPVAGWRSQVPGEQHHSVPTSRQNGRRIWAEQHFDLDDEPVMDASRSISHVENEVKCRGCESV